MSDSKQIFQKYEDLKQRRDKNLPLWRDISKYVGVRVDPTYSKDGGQARQGQQIDEFVDDPTAAISVVQGADYLVGIMWGTGEEAFRLKPSRYVKDIANVAMLDDWYDYATDQALYHMNHERAGLAASLAPYAYDQMAFGNSGIGGFENNDFKRKIDDNCLVFRNYGIDNACIDEGKSGLVEYVFVTHSWHVNRIVNEFCTKDGAIDKGLIAKLPKKIRDAYEKSSSAETTFNIVFGVFPREDFNPKMRGKRGTRYRGVWFLEDDQEKGIFKEEDFAEFPVAYARQMRVRGDVYGRSYGTMLLSSIKAVNFMVSVAIEVAEKMAEPALGVFNNAVFGDSVLDTSSKGLTVFNPMLAGGNAPTFPLYDVGDPSALVQFLIPYLNEKITTAFKIDSLLDFNSAKEMTASESMHRYTIRGQSLSGMLKQQKNELLVPIVKRSVSVCWNSEALGIDPNMYESDAARAVELNKKHRIIPKEVLEVIEQGKPWFEIEFNNELESLTRTQRVEAILKTVQTVQMVGAMYPDILMAVEWHKLVEDVNEFMNNDSTYILDADTFKKQVEENAQMMRQQMALQAGKTASEIDKNTAESDSKRKESNARGTNTN